MVKSERDRCSLPNLVTILVICNLSVIPVQTYECPYDLHGHVRFYLYSSSIPDRVELFPFNVTNLVQSGFAKHRLTKFITHGFTEHPGFSASTKCIIKAYKKFTNFNLILVDWSAVSGRHFNEYGKVVKCVRSNVSQYLAYFINFLHEQGGVPRKNFHLIGHSLGGQLIGIAANYINFKVSRMTGLDPAGPLFDFVTSPEQRLDDGDATLVDVLHTDSGYLGTEGPDGTIDFYVNGGSVQPGCDQAWREEMRFDSWRAILAYIGHAIEEAISKIFSGFTEENRCDHDRSYQVFARSIDPVNEFPSSRCELVEHARSAKCYGNTGYAGNYLRNTRPGVYYTSTAGYHFPNLTHNNCSTIKQ